MKKTNLTIAIESEKFDVLCYHLAKKEIDLQAKLADEVDALYVKHVPQPTREYLEDKLKREENKVKPKPTAKPSAGE